MFSDLITIVGVSKKLRKVNGVIGTGWIGQIFRLTFSLLNIIPTYLSGYE